MHPWITWLTSRLQQWISLTEVRLRQGWSLARFRPTPSRGSRPSSPPLQLATAACATVVIPALNEAKRIADVVAYALRDPATAEVIVVDDSSVDDTAALAARAGAKVITSSMLGKGASMHDGVLHAQRDLLVFLDGDLAGLRPNIITDLCMPLLRGDADFVKARFGRAGGRVTELTAKPMLKIFFPEVAHFMQPLGGIIAARKSLLQALPFEDGYGVDVGLLLDAQLAGARLAEVDIGSLEHESQSLNDLSGMASEVGRVIFARARAAGRLHVEQIGAMFEAQRQAAADIAQVLDRRNGRKRLLLLDMDGVVTESPFALELARATGHEQAYLALPANGHGQANADASLERTAKLFHYVHKRTFEQVARALPIRPGVVAFVNQMRRRGFMVGVVSDGCFVAADIVRRRVFADFAVANTYCFENEVCNGQARLNPAYLPEPAAADAAPSQPQPQPPCKSRALRRLLDDGGDQGFELSWVVCSQATDLALMRMADRAFLLGEEFVRVAPRWAEGFTPVATFDELLSLLPDHGLVSAEVEAQAA
jgi:glycosyltransferase involved in cell wall biosynthesis